MISGQSTTTMPIRPRTMLRTTIGQRMPRVESRFRITRHMGSRALRSLRLRSGRPLVQEEPLLVLEDMETLITNLLAAGSAAETLSAQATYLTQHLDLR